MMMENKEALFLLTHTKQTHYSNGGVTIYWVRDSDNKLDGPWDSWYDTNFKYKFLQCKYKDGKYISWKLNNVFNFKCNYVNNKISNFIEVKKYK